MEWPDNELELTVPKPADGTKISLLGDGNHLDWSYKNGKLAIDTSILKFSQVASKEAWVFKLENF